MIEQNIATINEQLKRAVANSRRSFEDITIIAVTKYSSVETVKEAFLLGLHHFGENRVDKLIEKQEALMDEAITWHLIGTLQRRKVKDIINRIDYFHALDSFKLASEIEKRAEKVINCFVQINVSQEETKHGIMVKEACDFIERLSEFSKIKVVGLMTMAPIDATEDQEREIFAALREIQEKIKEKKLEHAPCTELSMGMSRDFPIAVEEGATFIRVGSSIFTEDSNGTIR